MLPLRLPAVANELHCYGTTLQHCSTHSESVSYVLRTLADKLAMHFALCREMQEAGMTCDMTCALTVE